MSRHRGQISKSGARKSKLSTRKSKPSTRKSKFCATKSLDFLRRIKPFQGLRRPLTSFFFRASSGFKRARELRVRPGFILGPSVFVFSSSGLVRQAKGWRHAMVADGPAAFPRTRRPRAARARQREQWRPTGQPEDPRKKTGRSIRRPAEIRPLERGPIRLGPSASGLAPALHAMRSISQCLSSSSSLRFRLCEADAAAFRRVHSGAPRSSDS